MSKCLQGWFCLVALTWASISNAASLSGPHAISRIADDMIAGIRSNDDVVGDLQQELATTIRDLSERAVDEPEAVRLFQVSFGQPLSICEVTKLLDERFEYIDQIVFKSYDPARDSIWTTSIGDYELYEGSAREKMSFFVDRHGHQQRIVALYGQESEKTGIPKTISDVYAVVGYATTSSMEQLVLANVDRILHLGEPLRPMPYSTIEAIRAGLRKANRLQKIPGVGTPLSCDDIRGDGENNVAFP